MNWYNVVGKNGISLRDLTDEDGQKYVPALFKGEEVKLIRHNNGFDFEDIEADQVGQEIWAYPISVFFPDSEEITEYGWPEGSIVEKNRKGPFIKGGRSGVIWATSYDMAKAEVSLRAWLKGRETYQIGFCHRDGDAGIFPPPPEGYMYHEVHGHWEGSKFGLAYPKPIYKCRVPGYGSWLNHWEEWLAGCRGYDQMEVVPGSLVWIQNEDYDAKWIQVEDLKGWQDQNPFKVVMPKFPD